MRLKWSKALFFAVGLVLLTLAIANRVSADDKSAPLYKQKCATCHGADGKGDTPAGKAMKVRSFADPQSAGMSDAEYAEVIEKGKGKMPKYGATMKAEEIKDMVAYLRTLAK